MKLSILNNDSVKVASSYGNIGNSHINLGNNKNAIESYNKALEIFEIKNNIYGLASLYGVLGNLYLKIYENQKAINNYNKAKSYFKTLKDEFGIATCNMNIGTCNKNLDKYKKALKYYNKAESTYNKMDYKHGLSEIYGNKGVVYFALKDYKKALSYHKKSLSISSNLKMNKNVVYSLDDISKCYIEMENFNIAINYSFLALDSIKKYSFNNIKSAIYFNLYNAYNKKENYKLALKYFKLHKSKNDSVFYVQKKNNLDKLLTEFETKEKEKEIVVLNKEKQLKNETIKHQKELLIFFISAFIIILFLGLFILRLFIFKKKANSSLKLQNDKINQQKEEIETQKNELEAQNILVKKQHKNIKASIKYASYIQNSILPPSQLINEIIPNNFVFFKPKDIVSGDFYWVKKVGQFTIYAAADCTGHGVPGAFMSMLGISFLNEIIVNERLENPAEILNKLRNKVKISLRQTVENTKSNQDGIDIALCVIDNENLLLEYAGAYNPLYIVRNNELIEIKATENPIGIYLKEEKFKNNKFQLKKNDILYTFSDGYADQFGGVNNSKFKTSVFKKLLIKVSKKTMKEQHEILNSTLLKWQGTQEQTDDILIFAVKI